MRLLSIIFSPDKLIAVVVSWGLDMDLPRIRNLIVANKTVEALEIFDKLKSEFVSEIPSLSPNFNDLLSSYTVSRAKCFEKFLPCSFNTSCKDSSFIALR